MLRVSKKKVRRFKNIFVTIVNVVHRPELRNQLAHLYNQTNLC